VFCLFVIFLCFVPIIACVSGCFILNSPFGVHTLISEI
jgi:hypothetical protein